MKSNVASTRAAAAGAFSSTPPGACTACERKYQLRLCMRNRWGDPFDGYHYHLRVDGKDHRGMTGRDGKIEAEIDTEEGTAELDVWLVTPGDGEKGRIRWAITYGSLEPVTTPEGLQARLENAGYDVGAKDGNIGLRTKRELHTFQARECLPPDGRTECETASRLLDHNEGT